MRLQLQGTRENRNCRTLTIASAKKGDVIMGRLVKTLPIAVALTLSSAQALPQDDGEGSREGELAFNSSCRTCHSTKDGDNRLGPNLHGIIGREAGSEEYAYSPALKSSDIVWDADTLDRFIENPESVIPGNNMKPYGGISDPEVRASIVSHLGDAGSADADEGE
jgi:cytochrome c